MIHQQSVFEPWPIESESVQSVITSPPYYNLRKYDIPDVIIGENNDCKHEFGITKEKILNLQAGNPEFKRTWRKDATQSYNHGSVCMHCNAWKGQYGLEPTPQMYVEHTRLWAKEAWRVLRNDGVMFLNLSDSYAGSGGSGGDYNKGGLREGQEKYKQVKINYPSKCQLLIPHRVAIALVDDGWTLRNTIVWHSTNKMPESVTDRFSKKYEYIFMFTKQEKYYFDLDSIREKCLPINRWGGSKLKAKRVKCIKCDGNGHYYDEGHEGDICFYNECERCHSTGEYPALSSWDKGTGQSTYRDRDIQPNDGMKNPGDVWIIPTVPSSEKHYAMWPERLVERMIKCSTKAGDTVLDCFAGSGTTLKVAEQLHRKGIGIDLGYHEISKRRTSKIQKELFV